MCDECWVGADGVVVACVCVCCGVDAPAVTSGRLPGGTGNGTRPMAAARAADDCVGFWALRSCCGGCIPVFETLSLVSLPLSEDDSDERFDLVFSLGRFALCSMISSSTSSSSASFLRASRRPLLWVDISTE